MRPRESRRFKAVMQTLHSTWNTLHLRLQTKKERTSQLVSPPPGPHPSLDTNARSLDISVVCKKLPLPLLQLNLSRIIKQTMLHQYRLSLLTNPSPAQYIQVYPHCSSTYSPLPWNPSWPQYRPLLPLSPHLDTLSRPTHITIITLLLIRFSRHQLVAPYSLRRQTIINHTPFPRHMADFPHTVGLINNLSPSRFYFRMSYPHFHIITDLTAWKISLPGTVFHLLSLFSSISCIR
jgi:hypothetical protein